MSVHCRLWIGWTLWYFIVDSNQMKAWSSLEQPTSQRLWISKFAFVSLDKRLCKIAEFTMWNYKCQWLQPSESRLPLSTTKGGHHLWTGFWYVTDLYSNIIQAFFFLSLIFFSALIRPGRFDMQVTVPKPDVKGRTEILNWYLKKIKVDSGAFFYLLLFYTQDRTHWCWFALV